MKKKTLVTYGARRQTVRVYRDGHLVRVQWRDRGIRKTKSWADTPTGRLEAKAWARGFSERRERPEPTAPIRMRELWERYWTAQSGELRTKSQIRYRERWLWWERFVGRDAVVADVTVETATAFRRSLEGVGKATNQIRLILGVVRIAFRWGVAARLLSTNPLEGFRFRIGKDKPAKNVPAEYRAEDFEKLVGALDAQGWQWRSWVTLMILGHQGTRVNAVLHLRWEDVDWDRGELIWRKAWDKLGREWRQPMREGTYSALLTSAWHQAGRKPLFEIPTSGPVLPAARVTNREGVYRVQAFWYALQGAEKRAGVPHLQLRAAHGLRRMIVNEILEATGGDSLLAADTIGDKSIEVVEGDYRRVRADRVSAVMAQLDRYPSGNPGPGGLPKSLSDKSHRSDLNRRPLGIQKPLDAGKGRDPRPENPPNPASGPDKPPKSAHPAVTERQSGEDYP